MKKNYIFATNSILIICIVLFLIPWHVNAQKPKSIDLKNIFNEYWYIGLNGGKSNYIGDLNNNSLWNSNFDFGAGGIIGHQISSVFGVRIQFVAGNLSSNSDNDFKKSLESKYWDCGYQVTMNINQLFSKYNSSQLLNLYIFAGPSMASYHSIIKNEDETNYRETDGRYNEMLLILGGGVSVRLAKQLDLNLEYAHHYSLKDDRLDFNDLVNKNDKFSYTSVGLSYKILEKDKDKDGVIDKKDLCPDIPGRIDLAGCPDKDNDRIADKDDACPDIPGKPEFNGCPDTDGDGVIDSEDELPTVAGLKELKGCPDKDGDGVADKDDKCPDVAGKKELGGCPDKDNDGIADKDDACPEVKGLAKFQGCPDTDGDGIADKEDKCPDVVGVTSNFGCPEVMKKKFEYFKVVYFGTNKSVPLTKYTKDLDEVVTIMNEHSDVSVNVEGYADSQGEDAYNMKLSEKRADYVFNYLVKKGIAKERLVKKSFGEANPVGDNTTPAGRDQNRRVEIKTIK